MRKFYNKLIDAIAAWLFTPKKNIPAAVGILHSMKRKRTEQGLKDYEPGELQSN